MEQIAQPSKEFDLDTFLVRQQLVQRAIPLLEPVQIYPVRDPVASSEPEFSCRHVHRQNRSPAIEPAHARCPDGKDDWPLVPALDRQKAVCWPFAHGLSLAPTHPECSPDPVGATASALPASVPSRQQESLQCARCRRPNPL